MKTSPRRDEIDAATRERFLELINSLSDRYGGIVGLAKAAGMSGSTLAKQATGGVFPKVPTLDLIAKVWKPGGEAQDLLAYLRGRGSAAAPKQKKAPLTLLWHQQIQGRSAREKLELATLLLEDLRREMPEEVKPSEKVVL